MAARAGGKLTDVYHGPTVEVAGARIVSYTRDERRDVRRPSTIVHRLGRDIDGNQGIFLDGNGCNLVYIMLAIPM